MKITIFYLSLLFFSTSIYCQQNDSISLLFVGRADIQRSFTEGSEIPANTGLGLIFNRTYTNFPVFKQKINIRKIELEASINVASTADTLKAEMVNNRVNNLRIFGSSILIPGNSGQAAYVDFKVHLANKKVLSGLRFRFNASNRIWSLNDSIGSYSRNVVPLSLGLGPFSDFIPLARRKDYSILMGAMFVFHGIYGDTGNRLDNDFRTKILGHERVQYYGFELNANFKLKNLVAEISPTIIFNVKDYILPGLTGFQLRTAIRFTGGFPLVIENI